MNFWFKTLNLNCKNCIYKTSEIPTNLYMYNIQYEQIILTEVKNLKINSFNKHLLSIKKHQYTRSCAIRKPSKTTQFQKRANTEIEFLERRIIRPRRWKISTSVLVVRLQTHSSRSRSRVAITRLAKAPSPHWYRKQRPFRETGIIVSKEKPPCWPGKLWVGRGKAHRKIGSGNRKSDTRVRCRVRAFSY